MGKKTLKPTVKQGPRRIIVSYGEPTTIHKSDEPTIWIYLSGNPMKPFVVAYSNSPFYNAQGRKQVNEESSVTWGSHVYQASNFHNHSGTRKMDHKLFVERLAILNSAEVDWSGSKIALEKIAASA